MVYREFDFFLLKKHYCSKCGNLLLRKKVKRIIDQNSKEAYSYSIFDGSSGDINLNKYCLECLKCNSIFTIKEQKIIEKAKKKAKHK